MAIRSTNPGKIQTPGDSQRTIIHELRELRRAIVGNPISNTGVATEATLLNIDSTLTSSLGTIESILQDLETGQTNLTTLLERANWSSIVGNSIEITYYAGVAAGNPSGSTSNIETTVYKTGVSTIFTQTMTYNAANQILTITTT